MHGFASVDSGIRIDTALGSVSKEETVSIQGEKVSMENMNVSTL